MIQKAKYIGMTPMMGVQRGEYHEIDIFTINSEHGTPYLWVRAVDTAEYMMPYVSVLAMLGDWQFSEHLDKEVCKVGQEELVDRWFDVYAPAAEPVLGNVLPLN